MSRPIRILFVSLTIGALFVSGCTDIREYSGTWSGGIVSNPRLRVGFDGATEITVVIDRIDRSTLEGRITLGPSQAATAGFTDTPLVPVEAARNDVLGDLSFDGDPLGTYLFFITPDDPAEEHALVLISAHEGDRLEIRVLRHDLYGIFNLSR